MTIRDGPFACAPGEREWLEADRRGGFASGTESLVRTRRYHALLLSATNPPGGRFALVSGLDVFVTTPAGTYALSSQIYGGEGNEGDVLSPDGRNRITRFSFEPWPRWTFSLDDGTTIDQEIFVSRATGATVVSWRANGGGVTEPRGMSLAVRPLLSGRDLHALQIENPDFRFEPEVFERVRVWKPYRGVPAFSIRSDGEYAQEPLWYRNFVYPQERDRGLDFHEDLASPGVFRFDLSRGEAVLILEMGVSSRPGESAVSRAQDMRRAETARRAQFRSRLERSADAYVVRRGKGKTIIAGYPWFGDWGRDTFISLRGLCLATGRLSEARDILMEWAAFVSEGMLPNRFPESEKPDEPPEYNAVDASLWFAVAVHEYLEACRRRGRRIPVADRATLGNTVTRILEGYSGGTRYGIRADADGLLAAGVPGVQLTWMDAKIGDRVVTPRVGKPVEVQALWINALRIGNLLSERWGTAADRASDSFAERFWRPDEGCLHDVVDCDHVPGTTDPSFRPNQIFAVGGLPFPILSGPMALRIVDEVERRLWTPAGLRSLAPDEPSYRGRCCGGVEERDAAYHQGTVWPWLTGAFVEAWVRVHGAGTDVLRTARQRFLDPLLSRLDAAGLGHLPEIADGDAPHHARGALFQAWSVAEAIRLDQDVLVEGGNRRIAGAPAAVFEGIEP